MELEVAAADVDDLDLAVGVWRAANAARGLAPTAERTARVQEKVRAVDALVVVVREGSNVVAMALAEPGRSDDGAGEITPGHGHVSMVFVALERWGRGIGGALMTGLHQHATAWGWTTTTLWTRQSNERAQRLYAATGYQRSGRSRLLPAGDQIAHLHRSPSER